jgi:hypothetical protein
MRTEREIRFDVQFGITKIENALAAIEQFQAGQLDLVQAVESLNEAAKGSAYLSDFLPELRRVEARSQYSYRLEAQALIAQASYHQVGHYMVANTSRCPEQIEYHEKMFLSVTIRATMAQAMADSFSVSP